MREDRERGKQGRKGGANNWKEYFGLCHVLIGSIATPNNVLPFFGFGPFGLSFGLICFL